jgi:hypothetical protein
MNIHLLILNCNIQIVLIQIHYLQFVFHLFVHSRDYVSLPHYGANEDDDDDIPNNKCEKSLQSLFDALTTPSKEANTHDISRFDNNTLTYLSPATTRLHKDICGNSSDKCFGHTTVSLRNSRKSILENIDWMIQYGRIEENADAAEIFDEMEKFVQEAKLKMQNKILIKKNRGRKQGTLEFAAYDGKKKKAESRLKGYAG